MPKMYRAALTKDEVIRALGQFALDRDAKSEGLDVVAYTSDVEKTDIFLKINLTQDQQALDNVVLDFTPKAAKEQKGPKVVK